MIRQNPTDQVQRSTPFLVKGVDILFSFETIFVLFILAGLYKSDTRFSWVPVDLTLLFLCLSVTAAVLLLILRRANISGTAFRGILLYLIFSSWISFTLIWAPINDYAIDKVIRTSTLVFWAFAAPALIIASKQERVFRFYFLLVVASACLAVETWINHLSTGSPEPELKNILGGTYMSVGLVVGIAIDILLVNFLLERKTHFLLKIVFVALIVWFLLTLLVLGGRGPLFTTMVSVLVAFLLAGKNLFRSIFRLTPLALIFAVLFSIVSDFLPLTTLYRIQVLFEESGGGSSAQERLERMEAAWKQISEAPVLGLGVGSFYWYYGDPSLPRDFPHNIVLELWAETGIIGLFLFFLLIFFGIKKIKWSKISQLPAHFTAVIILVNTLFHSMISGHLPDDRLLFVTLGLLIGLSTFPPANKRKLE